MQADEILLDPNTIMEAFRVMMGDSQNRQMIGQADQYLRQCEQNNKFSLVLIELFTKLQQEKAKLQVLLHVKNVMKRNWTSGNRTNKGSLITQAIRIQIKDQLINIYRQEWSKYYRQFNQIFKFLARKDFPTQYIALHSFLQYILQTLSNLTIEQVLTSQELLPYLSLVKTVLKQFRQRSYGLTAVVYENYISVLIEYSAIIQQKIMGALGILKNEGDKIQFQLSTKLLQCSRKVDKIILYGLQCTTSQMQKNPKIINIIQYEIFKLHFLLEVSNKKLSYLIQLNILAIVEGLFNIQSKLPFLFVNFLQNYLQTIIKLLLSANFEEEKLINSVIQANTKPFLIFAYYMEENQFKNSIYGRKGNINCDEQQKHCHQIYMNIYAGPNIENFLEQVLTSLMAKYPRDNQEDQLIFQDAETKPQSKNDHTTFDFLLMLVKNMITRFKNQLIPFTHKVIDHLLTQNTSNCSSLVLAMYEVVVLIPQIYEPEQIDLNKIFMLLEVTYANGNYGMFSRLIRYYHFCFSPELLGKSFDILTNIMAKNDVSHFTLYQSAACVCKLLSEHEQTDFHLQNMGICFSNIFNLLSFYKNNPNHLWNLMTLLNKILKVLSSQAISNSLQYIISPIRSVIEMKDNGSMTICAIAELLSGILDALNPDQQNGACLPVLELAFLHISLYLDNEDLDDVDSLHGLWVKAMVNHRTQQCPKQLNERIIGLFHERNLQVKEENPVMYCSLIQQYLMSGLLVMSPDDFLSVFNEMIKDPEDPQPKICSAIYSLYFTFSLINNCYLEQVVVTSMQILSAMINKISAPINSMRTQVMLVIFHHIVVFSPPTIFAIFNNAWPNYEKWFWPFIWTLSYLNHKYANKVAALALLSSIPILQDKVLGTPIDNQLPFDYVFKPIIHHLDPMLSEQAMNRYEVALQMNFHPEATQNHQRFQNPNRKMVRKVQLHIKREWAQADLKPLFRQKLSNLMQVWNWGMDDIEQRFDKGVVKKIEEVLKVPL